MRKGRSTGTPTLAEAARFEAIKETEGLAPVPGQEHYFAAPTGEVYTTNPSNRWRGKIVRLSEGDNGRGYLRVSINKRLVPVHAIIAETFIGPRPLGMEVNHKDGNKRNNKWQNLEYVTRSQNMKHAHAMGLAENKKGDQHHNARISRETAIAIKREYLSICVNGRLPDREGRRLSEKYGVGLDVPRQIAKGKSWGCLSNELP